MSTSRYQLKAVVKRVVLDTISLAVDAENINDALEKGRRVLDSFPDPHHVPDVPYCYIENRENCHTELISLDEKEERGVA